MIRPTSSSESLVEAADCESRCKNSSSRRARRRSRSRDSWAFTLLTLVAQLAVAGSWITAGHLRRYHADVNEPLSSRPFMPGYGMLPAEQGSGLLSWSWAEERLSKSRNYWLVSTWPDGRPHAMPVWGVWHDGSFWVSSSGGGRKNPNPLSPS